VPASTVRQTGGKGAVQAPAPFFSTSPRGLRFFTRAAPQPGPAAPTLLAQLSKQGCFPRQLLKGPPCQNLGDLVQGPWPVAGSLKPLPSELEMHALAEKPFPETGPAAGSRCQLPEFPLARRARFLLLNASRLTFDLIPGSADRPWSGCAIPS